MFRALYSIASCASRQRGLFCACRVIDSPSLKLVRAKVPCIPTSYSLIRSHGQMAKQQSLSLLPNDDPDLFTYTSGRYLYNETRRLSERSIKFNVQALKDIASRSLKRGAVASLRKLAEGGFNRVFLLTFEDGFEVIAKIPYNISVPERLATASEVATMDFLSSKELPVPRIHAWSADSNNPVGVEYIIMQKAPGKPLEDRWFHLTQKERVCFMESYIRLEGKLFELRLNAYGSIYYKDALPSNLQLDLHPPVSWERKDDTDRFCIGPTTDYMFWLGRYSRLAIDRGPCQ